MTNYLHTKAMCDEIVNMYASGQLTDKEFREMLNKTFHEFSIYRITRR